MKKPLLMIIAAFCVLLTSCSFKPSTSIKPQSDTEITQTSDIKKIQNAGMHLMGEAVELKLRDEKYLTQAIISVQLVVKPQKLNTKHLTLQGETFKVDERGIIAPEMIFGNTDKPVSMIMINYTVKNNAEKSCTFNAGSNIYRIDPNTYKIIDAENSYVVSQEFVSLVYVDAEEHNGSERECHLITLASDEEITVNAGYIITTEMLDSMLGYALNPFGTDIKSGIADVVIGYAK